MSSPLSSEGHPVVGATQDWDDKVVKDLRFLRWVRRVGINHPKLKSLQAALGPLRFEETTP